MSLGLSRIDRLYRTYDVAATLPGGGSPTLTGVDVALLPPGSGPTSSTVWIPAAYADGVATVLFAGPDADPTGAIVVAGAADLWIRIVDTPEIDAIKVERITVLNGGPPLAPPPVRPVESVNGQIGAVVLDAGDVGALPAGSGAGGALSGTYPNPGLNVTAVDSATAALVPDTGTATGAALSAAFDTAGLFRGRRVQPPVNASMITTFAAGHGWVNLSSTAATVGDDTSVYTLGSQSLKVTTKTDGTPGTVQKTGLAVNATGKNLRVWVRVENASQANQLIVYAGDAAMANYYTWSVLDTGVDGQRIIKNGEWVAVTLGFGSASTVGTPDRTAIAQMRLRVGGGAGQSITAYFGGVGLVSLLSAFPKGLVTFTCDDGFATQYNVMRPILDGKGWGATAYAIADLIDTAGSMSMSQLHSLERNNGWEIAGHASTAANHGAGLATLTTAQQEAELKNLRLWLADNGFRGLDHYAYPLGSFSAATDAVVAKYFASARTIVSLTRETARPHHPLRIRSRSVANTTTLSTVQAEIDAAYANGGWYVFTIHDLVTSPTLGTQWPTASFQSVVDYIAAKGDMPVLTMSDALARMDV